MQVCDIEPLAEIGVALLLFSLGLEISFRDLKPVKRIVLIGGPIQVLFTLVIATLAIRVMIGLLVIQDLAVIPMLIVLPQLNDLNNILPKLATEIGIAAAFLAVVVLVGTRVLPVLLAWILI